MSFTTLPDAPSRTPLFKDLDVRNLLRNPGALFRFLINDAWDTWLTLLGNKLKPLIVVATLNFPDTAAQTSSDLTVSVPGADLDHYAEVAPPNASVLANSCYFAWVSAVGVVTVRFINFSNAALNPASGAFTIVVRT